MISWAAIMSSIFTALEEQKDKGNIADFHAGNNTITVWGVTSAGTPKTFLIEVREA